MMRGRTRRRIGFAASMALCATLAASPDTARAGEGLSYKQMIERYAPSVVTVKFVMKMQGERMGAEEVESEVSGVLVDPSGIVLCSNSQLSSPMGFIGRMMGLTAEPKDMKVILGADEAEHPAKLLTRDTDLDLAWIAVTPEEGREPKTDFAAVDLGTDASPQIGDELFCVRRMGKLFNRAPAVRAGRVCGETDSPRSLLMASVELATTVGLPVFTADGKFAGMVVMQTPDDEDMQAAGNPMAMMGSMNSMLDMFSGMILPAKQVASATTRAKERKPDENPEEKPDSDE